MTPWQRVLPSKELTAIDAREKIGRAKSVPDEDYVAAYQQIHDDMTAQIEKIIAKAGAQDYD